jgi:RNA polymerase sigma-70 factor, ECF subfamily
MSRRDPLADTEAMIRRIYGYVAYRIGDGPDAEDVTSETFERAFRGRHTFDPEKGSPTAWLIGIARHCLSDLKRDEAISLAEPPEVEGIDPHEQTVSRLTLARATSSLDVREQELIALRYGADLTARRIAEVLGVRTNTVEVGLHRALTRLRALLEAGDGEAETEAKSRAIRSCP